MQVGERVLVDPFRLEQLVYELEVVNPPAGEGETGIVPVEESRAVTERDSETVLRPPVAVLAAREELSQPWRFLQPCPLEHAHHDAVVTARSAEQVEIRVFDKE